MAQSFRSKVLKRAHEVRRETGKSWPVCLALSWRAYRLVKLMQAGEALFSFEKKDGSLRHAIGTLVNLPEGAVKGEGNRKIAWTESYKMVSYWDVEKESFRSFKVANLIEVYPAD